MIYIERAQLDFHAVTHERGAHPAARRTFLERICRRRQINEMNAARVLLDVPVMCVPEDERLDLTPFGQQREECR